MHRADETEEFAVPVRVAFDQFLTQFASLFQVQTVTQAQIVAQVGPLGELGAEGERQGHDEVLWLMVLF
ncbi:MAG: hypothetical protein AAB365_00060 [Patescibacteria group bacterium]